MPYENIDIKYTLHLNKYYNAILPEIDFVIYTISNFFVCLNFFCCCCKTRSNMYYIIFNNLDFDEKYFSWYFFI